MIMGQETDPPKTWKILRPLVRGIDPTYLKNKKGQIITLFSGLLLWKQALKAGDIVEIGDIEDLQIWLVGRIVYTKVSRFKDISCEELEKALLRFAYPRREYNSALTSDEVRKLLSSFYQRRFTKNSKLVVTAVLVVDVRIPNYELRIN